MSKVYQIVTDRIIEQLKNGVVPWRRPWVGGIPANLKSKKPYRGINAFLLNLMGHGSPYFLTYKQAQELGGQVRKGERSVGVVFWKEWETKDRATGDDIKIPVLRYYRVFHVSQCDGIADPFCAVLRDVPVMDECETVIANMPKAPVIKREGGEARAYYRPATDLVNMPDRSLFEGPESYYSTFFHELAHSTGHDSRLNRKGITELAMFGSHEYSREELVAEMGAAFLSGHVGIVNATIDNSAAYINSWLGVLRKDPQIVVIAAAQAQKAADFILGKGASDGQA